MSVLRDNVNSGPAGLRKLLSQRSIMVPGAFNAMSALIAEKTGFDAVYISGSGVAGNMGLPDLSVTTLTEVVEECRRMASAVKLPVIVDADTGFGETVNVIRTVRDLEHAGASAIHIEDQVLPKRCGHLKGKRVVPVEDMLLKIEAARSARKDRDFMIIVRTDSRAVEGFDSAVERIKEYVRAGADAIFPEALETEDEFREVASKFSLPLMANMTEFGKSPLLSYDELSSMGYRMVLFPLTAFRTMLKSVENIYSVLKEKGTQRESMDMLMTRKEYYEYIRYDEYEREDSELLDRARR